MTIALAILAFILVVALVWLSRQEGDYHVCRDIIIRAEPQVVFDKVRDFKTWRDWSPWLIHEPETRLSFSDTPDQEGGWYTWDGQFVGAGKLTHERFDGISRIDQRIEFQRPFKSVSSVFWEFEPHEGGTRVYWNMQGSMPFFMRFMTRMMKQMIAKDYDLGLAMLSGELDPEAERPVLHFNGRVEFPSQSVLSTPFAGGIADMETAMEKGFCALFEHAASNEVTPSGASFAAYHKADIKSMYFECDMALPLDESVASGEFERKALGGGTFFEVMLEGSYDFMELAWYSAMAHIRMVKLKMDNSRPSFEVYERGPADTEQASEYRTRLLIPLK